MSIHFTLSKVLSNILHIYLFLEKTLFPMNIFSILPCSCGPQRQRAAAVIFPLSFILSLKAIPSSLETSTSILNPVNYSCIMSALDPGPFMRLLRGPHLAGRLQVERAVGQRELRFPAFPSRRGFGLRTAEAATIFLCSQRGAWV